MRINGSLKRYQKASKEHQGSTYHVIIKGASRRSQRLRFPLLMSENHWLWLRLRNYDFGSHWLRLRSRLPITFMASFSASKPPVRLPTQLWAVDIYQYLHMQVVDTGSPITICESHQSVNTPSCRHSRSYNNLWVSNRSVSHCRFGRTIDLPTSLCGWGHLCNMVNGL